MRELLDFVQGLYHFQTTEMLSRYICQQLPGLVASENVAIGQHDGKRRILTSMVARHMLTAAPLMPELNESGVTSTHPFWDTIFDQDRPVVSVTDVMARKEWLSNPFYSEVFKPDGIEGHLKMEVFGTPDQFTTLNILRTRPTFTSDEMELLSLLYPHFTQAYMNTHMLERAGLVTEPASDCWMIPIDTRGRVTGGDQFLLPQLGDVRRNLPELVQCWVADRITRLEQGRLETQLKPYMLKVADSVWTFTLHRDESGQDPYILSIRRACESRKRPQLSLREAEVIDWVAAGKSNEEISEILKVSLNTVKTHLKRSFIKLGVENRTAAVAAWKLNLMSPSTVSVSPPSKTTSE